MKVLRSHLEGWALSFDEPVPYLCLKYVMLKSIFLTASRFLFLITAAVHSTFISKPNKSAAKSLQSNVIRTPYLHSNCFLRLSKDLAIRGTQCCPSS